MAPVTLYDIPTKAPKECWSLNPWKPRMILNYKGVDYKTEWVEYPDLAPTFKEIGIPPNDKDDPGYFMDYTSPAIRFDDGSFMMDSWKIAQELEKRYPTPSLGLDEPIVKHIQFTIIPRLMKLGAVVLPKIPQNLLSKPSADYFESTREEMFGMPLAQLEKEKGEEAWKAVEGPAKEVGDLLRKNGGPFFLGDRVTYADFVIVTFLEFLRRAEVGIFERFLTIDPAFGKVYDASKEWLKKAD